MARAKRTDRADARRRYRATQAEVPDVEGDDSDEGTDAGSTSAPKAAGAASSGTRAGGNRQQRGGTSAPRSGAQAQPVFAPGQRPSFTASFRAAARPFNVRQDIAYIPEMALRSHAVWLPAAAAVGSGALFLAAQPLGSNGLANLLFQLFVLPPTIAGSFLAGILAKRATYIAGGIAALIGALVFTIAIFVTPVNPATTIAPGASASPSPAASAAPSGSDAGASASAASSASEAPAPSASPAPTPAVPLSDADKFGAALQSILVSVPFGIAIGAFGGYYKRFLSVSNPARQRRELERQRQKGQRGQPPKKRF